MILPIVTYGNTTLRKKALSITERTNELDKLISDMFETLIKTKGVGLSATQVNRQISLFIVLFGDFEEVFINAEILEYSLSKEYSSEGCLSIPDITEDVKRSSKIKIKYLDAEFEKQIKEYEEIEAVIIQHEYDHTEGILFIDKLSPIKKKLIAKKIENIRKNKFSVNYKINKFV